jgi:putative two-component system response regulator
MEERESVILVVDDAEINIDILMGALGDMYDVSVAMDGETALETARDILPDLILLDIMMPGMDGYEVCRHLKEDPATRGIPVIFLTALTEVEDKAKGFEAGAADYITKPFDVEEVDAKVRAILSRRHDAESTGRPQAG